MCTSYALRSAEGLCEAGHELSASLDVFFAELFDERRNNNRDSEVSRGLAWRYADDRLADNLDSVAVVDDSRDDLRNLGGDRRYDVVRRSCGQGGDERAPSVRRQEERRVPMRVRADTNTRAVRTFGKATIDFDP